MIRLSNFCVCSAACDTGNQLLVSQILGYILIWKSVGFFGHSFVATVSTWRGGTVRTRMFLVEFQAWDFLCRVQTLSPACVGFLHILPFPPTV